MTPDAPPWSTLLRLAEVQRGPRTLRLAADAPALVRIARLLELSALSRLEGEAVVAPWLDGADVRVCWRAELQQICSVTAEPFDGALHGDFHVRVLPADSRAAPAAASDISLDPDAEDPPDVLEGDAIDLGAYLVEALALELDPFARAPGAEFRAPDEPPEPSPFAALVSLKRDS